MTKLASPTVPPFFTVTPTAYLPIATTTPPSPHPLLASLPAGQYIVFYGDTSQPDKTSLNVVSIQGVDMGQLAIGPYGGAYLSPDGKRVLFENSAPLPQGLSIIDLTTNMTTPISLDRSCSSPSWSSDGQSVALECDKEIYVLSLRDGTLTHLTNWSKHAADEHWAFPAWSPDGKQIAYYNIPDPKFKNAKAGYYLTDASCLSKPETCHAKTQGPFSKAWTEGLIWSPDSRYLAVYYVHQVGILDTQGKNSHVLKIEGDKDTTEISSFAWSPDGKWIAYSCPNGLFLVSPEGGKPTQVIDRDNAIAFWLEIP